MKRTIKGMAIVIATTMAFGSLAFSSCNKVEEVVPVDNASQHAVKTLSLSDNQRRDIARRIAEGMASQPASFSQLNQAIHLVNSYGVDEHLYIFDILKQEQSVFLPMSLNINQLRQAVVSSSIVQMYLFSPSNYYGMLQFYWPYHDMWDGSTKPIIVFEPIGAPTVVYGYQVSDDGTVHERTIQTVMMDTLVRRAPLLIIKEAEFDYSIYPVFKNGVYSKDGRTWLRPTTVIGQDGNPCYVDQTTVGDTVYEASCFKFKSSGTQYDSWFFGGGSEFVFNTAFVLPNGEVDTNMFTFELTRKEIEDEVVKKFNSDMILHPNWQPENASLHYRFYERDAGGLLGQYSVSLSYQGTTVSATIKTNSSDDVLGQGTIVWSTYHNWCQTANNETGFGSPELFWIKMRLYSI